MDIFKAIFSDSSDDDDDDVDANANPQPNGEALGTRAWTIALMHGPQHEHTD